MNFKLAKEIYGNAWFMDVFSLQKYSGLLEHLRNGGNIDASEGKSNDCTIFRLKDQVTVTDRVFEAANDDKGNDYVSVINIDGPITKYGGLSSYGTVDLANKLKKFENLDNVIGHILYTESGGGSANAIKYITDVIENEIEKPVVSFIEDMSASAAYYINAFSDYIIANDEDALIGSIGTLIEMAGYPKIAEDKNDGLRYVRIYADEAFNKNKEFEEAINNLNFKPIKDKILNPHNDKFKEDVSRNRSNVRDIELTGEIFKAKDVVGTLIDSIGSFDDAVKKVTELSSGNSLNSSLSINENKLKMTIEDLKAQHPSLYNEVFASGVSSGTEIERDRVEAYLEFVEVDAESVKKQIADGNQITHKFMAEMTKKMTSNSIKNNIEEEAATEIDPSKKKDKTKEVEEAENFEAEVQKHMGFKTEGKE